MNAALLLAAALAATASDSEIVATYRDGRVERGELESWRRYLGHEDETVPVRADIEELVLVKVLASRYDRTGPTPEYQREHRLLALELSEAALREHMASGIRVAPEEVEAAVAQDPASRPQPRLYALENIFKRCPSGGPREAREAARRRLEELRRRVMGGEDFAALAEKESDSETRLRGGRAGYVDVGLLAPEVAAVVKDLGAGQLAIVESGAGLTLLRVSRILEPTQPDLVALRRRLEVRLSSRKLDAAWEESSQALLAGLQLEARDPSPGAGPETVVASFRSRDADAKADVVTKAEIGTFLKKRGLPDLDDMKTAAERRDAVVQRVLLEARDREARRLGLVTEALQRRLELKSLELRAQLAANALAGAPPEPSDGDLRAAYDKDRDGYRRPPRWRLRALRLRIDPSQPASLYERMRLLGEQASNGKLGFQQLAEQLSPQARLEDVDWLSEPEVWRLGLNAESAVRGLPAGASTHAFQEGKELIILNVVEREEDRPLSFDEARPAVRSQLLAKARRSAGRSLRESILAEQDVQVRN